MATPAEPAATEPTGALFRALRSAGVEADLAYRADDEVRAQAGQNVIAAISAQIDAQSARLDAQSARLDAQITEFGAAMDVRLTRLETTTEARFAEIKAEIKAQTSRIDVLQRVIWHVIWPLVVLLAVPVFGLLYKALTD